MINYRLLICFMSMPLFVARADVVDDWTDAVLAATRTNSSTPTRASRHFAITQLVMFDVLNGIDRTHRPYSYQPTAPPGISVDAAVATAARVVLVSFYTNQAVLDPIEARYTAQLAAIADGPAKTAGVAYGEAVGQHFIVLRADDGYNAQVPFTPGDEPGEWRPTPPAFANGLDPQWPNMTPFTMTSVSQFRPHRPPPLSTSAYAFEVEILRLIGKSDSATRSADQTEIARFWADGGGTETPPGHWIRIAKEIAVAKSLALHPKARLLALTGLAVGDGGVISWDAKYIYNYWRPVTAIQEANTDGNPATVQDAEWLPLIVTPPFPEYTSGHSTFSRTSATVIERFFGTRDIPFSTTSDGLPNVTRGFEGPGAAADESGISRIYGGIHFPSGNLAAQAAGFMLGHYISDRFIQPLNALEFSLVRASGDSTDLEIQVTPNKSYRIEASSDLKTWTLIALITPTTTVAAFSDVNAPPGNRFYRAVEL